MNIRSATLEDLDAVMELVRSCTRHMDEQGIHQWDEIYPDEGTIQEDILEQHLRLVERNGDILGIIALNDEQPPQYQGVNWQFSGKALVVHRLAVAPTHQRHGLARKLMEYARCYAEARDYNTMRLDAFVHNPSAVKLYEDLGYRQAGTVSFRKGPFFCFERPVS
jgi:ribosomal protein S18 acetylase RimI-like enzyme